MLESLLFKQSLDLPKSWSWTRLLTDTNGYFSKRYKHGMVSCNGRIVVVGGYRRSTSSRLSDVQEFNPSGGYGTLASLSAPRADFGIVSDGLRFIWVFGGNIIAGNSNEMLQYDRTLNKWTSKGNGSPSAGTSQRLAYDGQYVWIHGGSGNQRALWQYDPVANTYIQKNASPVAFYEHFLFYYEGSLYAYGKNDPSVYRYSIETNAWSVYCAGPTPTGLGAASTAMIGSKVYLIGGAYGYNWPKQMYYIDLQTGESGVVDGYAMAKERMYGGAAAANGTIYQYGGGSGNPLNAEYGEFWAIS